MTIEAFSKRDVISFQASERALRWLEDFENMHGKGVTTDFVNALYEARASLNDFWLIYVYSGSDNIKDNLDLLKQLKAQIGECRALTVADVSHGGGKSKLGH